MNSRGPLSILKNRGFSTKGERLQDVDRYRVLSLHAAGLSAGIDLLIQSKAKLAVSNYDMHVSGDVCLQRSGQHLHHIAGANRKAELFLSCLSSDADSSGTHLLHNRNSLYFLYAVLR